ncbi:hypothetical protein HOT95_gp065 [Vibrio phage vB_VpS_PG07]|uniref:Uncharacterized protein n=1 Tax=Vibrio phage vB_VpS_PG07 TaxID=2301664 RepID=A0A385E4J0_9CAUD|nr:hypothetical protein HOT95_gp065 [Vibrio phage vB_VpS_PG07]AXQ66690.1 hypothetical protein [Vibrio phage vB_VpS_PG07]
MSKNRGEDKGIGVWVHVPKREENEGWFSKHDNFFAGFLVGASLIFIMALLIF